jgi:hypothetical protein
MRGKSSRRVLFLLLAPSPTRLMLKPECDTQDHNHAKFCHIGQKDQIRGHRRACCGLKDTEWGVLQELPSTIGEGRRDKNTKYSDMLH